MLSYFLLVYDYSKIITIGGEGEEETITNCGEDLVYFLKQLVNLSNEEVIYNLIVLQCTVTCGEGIQTRFVACTFNQQRQDDRFCDITVKPETEIRCNRGTCLTPDSFNIAVITSNKVVGTTHWRIGSWSAVSL